MDLVIFEENKPFILESFRDGDFDYIDAASEVFETGFFKFIEAKSILQKLAQTYPNPRKKEDVPLWFYVASNLSMRLHGALLQCISHGGALWRYAQCIRTKSGSEGYPSGYRGCDHRL